MGNNTKILINTNTKTKMARGKGRGGRGKTAKRSRSRTTGRKKRVSKIGRGRLAKAMVFKGSKAKTVGGLTKGMITRNKHGRYVSKKKSARGKKNAWMKAVARARRALKVKGFCPVGGKSAAGKRLLAKARGFYKK